MSGTDHIAHRPSWLCLSCDKPWPCDSAREELTAEMDGVALAMYCWMSLEEAVGHLPGMPVQEAFDRFISWTRPARVQPPAAA